MLDNCPHVRKGVLILLHTCHPYHIFDFELSPSSDTTRDITLTRIAYLRLLRKINLEFTPLNIIYVYSTNP